MSEPTVTEAEPTADRRGDHSPLRKTVRDMALSMGVIAGIIFAVLLITWRPQPDPVREIDPVPAAQTAQVAADFPLLLPTQGEGWRATSARFEPTAESDQLPVWFTGWVGPDDQYVAVVQSRNTTESFIEEQTITGVPDEAVTAPAGWQAYVSPQNDQRSLVRVTGGDGSRALTTVVTGTPDWAALSAVAAGLRPVPDPQPAG